MQIEGIIPFRSEMLYPKAVGYFLRTCNNFSVSICPRSALTITGHSSTVSRNSYLRPLDSVLSSMAGFFGEGIGSEVRVRHSLKYSS